MNNPHTGKTADDPDVHTILIHADERMLFMGYLQRNLGISRDTISCFTDQELFDLYLHHRFGMYERKKIESLRAGDYVTALVNGPVAVQGAAYEVFEIRLSKSYIGLTLLKPNSNIPRDQWCSFDVSGNNLSELFRTD
jgi:hypothetical protein